MRELVLWFVVFSLFALLALWRRRAHQLKAELDAIKRGRWFRTDDMGDC